MLPARAPAIAVLLLALLGPVTACGAGDAPLDRAEGSAETVAEPDEATRECRETWAALGEELTDRAAATEPSGLASRWNSVAATADYYATSATADDCGDRIDQQRTSDEALVAFGESLRRWDMPYQLAQVESGAAAYAAGPAPKPRRKGAAVVRPAQVRTLLEILRRQAPVATTEQAPAWQQAQVVDVADAAATDQARKDLAVVSGESRAYREAAAALATIRRAVPAG